MEFWTLIALLALAVFALLSRLLSNSPVTMPMACLTLGVGLHFTGGVPFSVMDDGLRIMAEVTLSVVLFADASKLTFRQLRSENLVPRRMLLIGLPLTVIVGTLMFLPIFSDLPFWQIALLAALLAPTDAALGQAVFTNEAVPENIREALTVESGLNDGLSLPIIIFAACAAVGFNHDLAQQNWLFFAGQQVIFGLFVGAALGALGGWASHTAIETGLAVEENSSIFALLLIALVYLVSDAIGGNSFVAVFVSGLLFGKFAKNCAERTRSFLETDGVLLLMAAFLYIGILMIPKGLALVDLQVVAAVVLSLFVIRPLAVWLSLAGSGLTLRTKLFLGWFGPRGLATALFTLFVLFEFEGKLNDERIMATVALTVLLSTFLHGISAHFAAHVFDGETEKEREQ